jgi:primosomal protein N' (replication factor Y)
MQEELRRGHTAYLSRQLIQAIEERMEKGEQVILLLNRRGFSPLVLCSRCGFVQKCPDCSVSLTMHTAQEKMMCHLCGHEQKPLLHCPRCRSRGIRFRGLGTQKLEIMMKKIFPDVTIGRMDTDSMSGKGAHGKMLNAFKEGELRILLGTQMIAKGLDFPNVTLVGVVCADTALHLPDFRASEYTFQLLTQVAGRAGRGAVPGEVVIQTFAPRHPAILAARTQDYGIFYRQELPFREELEYPPKKKLILITMKGRNEGAVHWLIGQCVKMLQDVSQGAFEVIGPAPSPISRVKGFYRWQAVCKGGKVAVMGGPIMEVVKKLKTHKNIQIAVDVDPISML